MMLCKHCKSKDIIKNGRKRGYRGGRTYRQQMYRCNACHRATMGKKVYKGETG